MLQYFDDLDRQMQIDEEIQALPTEDVDNPIEADLADDRHDDIPF